MLRFYLLDLKHFTLVGYGDVEAHTWLYCSEACLEMFVLKSGNLYSCDVPFIST